MTVSPEPPFEGFARPEQNWFKLPNNWTDIVVDMTPSEMRVVLYVLRHTWGFSEYGEAKRITIDEFMNGRKRRDGTRLDRGTGLSNRSVIDALKAAVAHGYLEEFVDDQDKGRVRKEYRLRLLPEVGESGVKKVHTGVKVLHHRGGETSPRSEKDTLERHPTVSSANGDLKRLPDLDEPEDKIGLMADDILAEYGDRRSNRFYFLVASKVPHRTIQRTIAEIRADGAEHPAKVFTYRMKRYVRGEARGGCLVPSLGVA